MTAILLIVRRGETGSIPTCRLVRSLQRQHYPGNLPCKTNFPLKRSKRMRKQQHWMKFKSAINRVTQLSLWMLLPFLGLSPLPSALGNGYDSRTTKGGPDFNPNIRFQGGDGPGQCSLGRMPNYWVNPVDRSYVVQDTELAYSGLGPPIRMTRTYNLYTDSYENTPISGMFGNHWRFAYEWTIRQSYTTQIYLQLGSGQTYEFRLESGATPPAEALNQEYYPNHNGMYFNHFTWHGDFWLFEEKSTRFVYRFDLIPGQEGEVKDYRLVSIADPYGNTVLISYASNRRIDRITDAAGRETTFEHNSAGLCTRLRAPDGRTATFEYDQLGNLIKSTDFAGEVTSYAYSWKEPDGGLIGEPGQNNYNPIVLASFTASGQTYQFQVGDYQTENPELIAVVNPLGQITRYEPHPDNEEFDLRSTVVTEPNGNKYSILNDETGNTLGYRKGVSHIYDWENNFGTFALYFEVFPARLVDSRKDVFLDYDADRGNLLRVEMLGGSSGASVYTYTYDDSDHLITATNPLRETWTYTWNDQHRVIQAESPSGRKLQFSYDAKGELVRETRADGSQFTFTYDRFGNLATVTDPLGNKVTFGYDNQGLHRLSYTDPRGNVTRYQYDANDRLIQTTYADGSFRKYSYDCCSGVSTKDERGDVFTRVRDPLLQVLQSVDAAGNATHYSYDDNGNLVGVRDALGHQVSFAYDEIDRITGFTDSKGEQLALSYDAFDQGTTSKVVKVRDQRGKETSFSYDYMGEIVSTTDPLGRTVTLKRDPLSRVVEVANGRGEKITFLYSNDGQVLEKDYQGSKVASYDYDQLGRLTGMTDSWGSTLYSYDAAGQVTKIQYPSGKKVEFAYDAAGNLSSITYPGGVKVSYVYDSRNRPVRASWTGSIDLTYDAAGNLLKVSRSNGTESTYTYDENNRLLSIRHGEGETSWADLRYTRNGVGNTTSESRRLPLPEFQAPGVTQVSVDAANQITRFGQDTLAYDADGNLTQAGTGLWAVYDPENRPTSTTRDGVTTRYTYDATGHRVASERGIWKRYFHFGPFGNLLFETDERGEVTVLYIYIADRLAARRTGSQDTFYHFDSRGSTLALTDSSGDILAAYSYDPFGKVIHRSGSIYNPFTYAGAFGVMDERGGLFFMKNRFYHASLQRFVQKDPLGFVAGANLYRYVANSPNDWIDPSGLFGLSNPFSRVNQDLKAINKALKQPGKALPGLVKTTAEVAKQSREDLVKVAKGTYALLKGFNWYADKTLGYYSPAYSILTSLRELGKGNIREGLARGAGAVPFFGTFISATVDLTQATLEAIEAAKTDGASCAVP
ncbi:MAG: RHS repeat domain-containing protein [Acidobacteriota bacterium]